MAMLLSAQRRESHEIGESTVFSTALDPRHLFKSLEANGACTVSNGFSAKPIRIDLPHHVLSG
jgi:hypothetical protein